MLEHLIRDEQDLLLEVKLLDQSAQLHVQWYRCGSQYDYLSFLPFLWTHNDMTYSVLTQLSPLSLGEDISLWTYFNISFKASSCPLNAHCKPLQMLCIHERHRFRYLDFPSLTRECTICTGKCEESTRELVSKKTSFQTL